MAPPGWVAPDSDDEDAEGNIKWSVPGGRIVWNVKAQSFDAHCNCHAHADNKKNPCRLNRTFMEDPRGHKSAQGRCLAFLLQWLHHASSCASSREHKDAVMKTRARPADLDAMSHANRLVWRGGWIDEHLTALASMERQPWPGEGPEPSNWP
jgi:hypothetical protein